MLVELRTTGHQTLYPGSVHPEGQRIRWFEHTQPTEIDPPTLVRAVSHLAAASLIARNWNKGSRDEIAAALIGVLDSCGWSGDEIELFLKPIVRYVGDEEAQGRLSKIQRTPGARAAGRHIYGFPTLVEKLGQDVVTKISEWLELNENAAKRRSGASSGTSSTDWPVPTPLMREPAPGLEYPVASLGPILSAATDAVVEIVQVPAALAGGAFLGSHAMSEEIELRTIAMLSRLWDGGTLDRVRAKEGEQTTLVGRRLSLHLMMQPVVAADLLGRALFRQQGFLARCLIAAPESLAGTRLHSPERPSSAEDPRIRGYEAAINALLCKPPILHVQTGDGLVPRHLPLAAQAKQLLVAAYDQMELAQGPRGALEPIREWASKAAEHACRMAAVITLLADPDAGRVAAESMHGAIALVEFYLSEYTRLVAGFNQSPELEAAQKLLTWLKNTRPRTVTVRRITQFGPSSLRVAEVARGALRTLADHGWVKARDRQNWDVHPALWQDSAP